MPRLEIGRWPTPIRRLDHTSSALGCEVWAKTEEDCGAWGGNKVRKLEYLLGAARSSGARKLVTYGAGGSTWAVATALHAKTHGFEVTLGLGGDVPAPHRRFYDRMGTRVIRLAALGSVPLAAALARAVAGRNARVLPAGGSGGAGDLGSAHAGIEIAEAVERGEMPAPANAFVAAGTGGTAAGLAVGMAMRACHCGVVAVRVTPRPLGTLKLIDRRMRALRRRLNDLRVPAAGMSFIQGVDSQFGPGYGKPHAAALEAAEIAGRDGLALDLTYGAKAFAALVDAARAGVDGPILFLHTSPGPEPDRGMGRVP